MFMYIFAQKVELLFFKNALFLLIHLSCWMGKMHSSLWSIEISAICDCYGSESTAEVRVSTQHHDGDRGPTWTVPSAGRDGQGGRYHWTASEGQSVVLFVLFQ